MSCWAFPDINLLTTLWWQQTEYRCNILLFSLVRLPWSLQSIVQHFCRENALGHML